MHGHPFSDSLDGIQVVSPTGIGNLSYDHANTSHAESKGSDDDPAEPSPTSDASVPKAPTFALDLSDFDDIEPDALTDLFVDDTVDPEFEAPIDATTGLQLLEDDPLNLPRGDTAEVPMPQPDPRSPSSDRALTPILPLAERPTVPPLSPRQFSAPRPHRGSATDTVAHSGPSQLDIATVAPAPARSTTNVATCIASSGLTPSGHWPRILRLFFTKS